jgi:hypothetical protein
MKVSELIAELQKMPQDAMAIHLGAMDCEMEVYVVRKYRNQVLID